MVYCSFELVARLKGEMKMRVQIRLITTDGSDPKSRQRNEWSSEDALTKEKIKTVAKWLRADKAIIKQKKQFDWRKKKKRKKAS